MIAASRKDRRVLKPSGLQYPYVTETQRNRFLRVSAMVSATLPADFRKVRHEDPPEGRQGSDGWHLGYHEDGQVAIKVILDWPDILAAVSTKVVKRDTILVNLNWKESILFLGRYPYEVLMQISDDLSSVEENRLQSDIRAIANLLTGEPWASRDISDQLAAFA